VPRYSLLIVGLDTVAQFHVKEKIGISKSYLTVKCLKRKSEISCFIGIIL